MHIHLQVQHGRQPRRVPLALRCVQELRPAAGAAVSLTWLCRSTLAEESSPVCGAPGSARVAPGTQGRDGGRRTNGSVPSDSLLYNSVCINNEIFLYYILVYTIEVIAAVLMKRPPPYVRVYSAARGGWVRLLCRPTPPPGRNDKLSPRPLLPPPGRAERRCVHQLELHLPSDVIIVIRMWEAVVQLARERPP